MRHAYGHMSPARRQHILDDCELAGRISDLPHLPDSIHALGDELSDTLLLKALDAHAAGVAQRTYDEYLDWITAHFAELSDECADAGVEDGPKWLRQTYTIRTGKRL